MRPASMVPAGIRGPAAILAACVLLAAGPAAAWRQAHTTPQQPGDPTYPLHVASTCVRYSIHRDCSADVTFEECLAAIDGGVRAWTDSDCSYIRFEPTPPASCCRVGYVHDGPNANCIMWREAEWPDDPTYPPDAVALTTLTYDRADGRILDSDVEFNGAAFTFAADGRAGVYDIRSTMAHEAGHMIGLDESEVREATMWPFTFPGETHKRDLHADDIEAVCTIYPSARDPNACRGPIGGLDLVCRPPDDGCGCRSAPARGPAGAAAALALACAAALRRKRPGVPPYGPTSCRRGAGRAGEPGRA